MSRGEATIRTYVDDELDFNAWVAALRDGVLLGQECESCGRVTTTPKAGCVGCGSRALTPRVLPTTGEVYSSTAVSVAPEGFEAGYRLALVELEGTGGARLLARLSSDAAIGETVELVGTVDGSGTPSPEFG